MLGSFTLKLDGVSCPACGSGDLIVKPSDKKGGDPIPLRECRNCVFAWQWPAQSDFLKSVAHASQRYTSDQENEYYKDERRKAVAQHQIEYVKDLHPKGETILDVGSGDGAFAAVAAEAGWRSIGIDPAMPRESEGNPILRMATLQDLDDGEEFDVVTLWDVIEHLDSPCDVLEQAARHVAPGGWLIVETGNYQSLERVQAGGTWWAYAADHRWYFTPSIVRHALEAQGLSGAVLAPRVLRPNADKKKKPRASVWRAIRKAPKGIVEMRLELQRNAQIRSALAEWPDWYHLSIFTAAAQKPSIPFEPSA
jgi:SAM-dependent methyltransferase